MGAGYILKWFPERTNQLSQTGTTSGSADLLLPPLQGRGKRGALERELRDAIRSGRLKPGAPLPSTRDLAARIGSSRRLVVEAYSQLSAEGYLVARRGSGTRVAGVGAGERRGPPPGRDRRAQARPPRYDLFPGSPDLALFPRRDWGRALRAALLDAPPAQLGYPPPAGLEPLREALAEHLGRVRGALAGPGDVLVTSGYVQGLRLVAEVLRERGVTRVAVEDPGFHVAWGVLGAAGVETVPVPVDEDGIVAGRLAATGAGAALVTPAHQFPLGVVLSASRRAELVEWARAAGALVIEDDYDAEIRHEREPVGSLQGLAPDVVTQLGTVSKTLAPGLRIGWMVGPAEIVDAVAARKLLHDMGTAALGQLALAGMLRSGAFDRHVRACTIRYRAKREALLSGLAEHLPSARVRGIAAGLHAVVAIPEIGRVGPLLAAAERRGVRAYPVMRHDWRSADGLLVLGYAGLGEGELRQAAGLLGEAVAETA
ncbi:MAG TPA: PLP-dependent aminotransferase family protein [Thermoleophilaceae bacterium]|nr:PLP-dependent aminotransferase family protein [Thermoleophilaceae bacterium]